MRGTTERPQPRAPAVPVSPSSTSTSRAPALLQPGPRRRMPRLVGKPSLTQSKRCRAWSCCGWYLRSHPSRPACDRRFPQLPSHRPEHPNHRRNSTTVEFFSRKCRKRSVAAALKKTGAGVAASGVAARMCGAIVRPGVASASYARHYMVSGQRVVRGSWLSADPAHGFFGEDLQTYALMV